MHHHHSADAPSSSRVDLSVMRRSIFIVLVLLSVPGRAPAADAARLQQAIGRGAAVVRSNFSNYHEGYKTIAALALLKAGIPAESLEVQAAISDIQKRVDPVKGYALGGTHAFYIAGVDAVLLSDANPEKYRGELAAIQKFIEQGQRPDGSWDYPGINERGDTSVTHYALLGLWACARADVPTRPEVWSSSIKWHLGTQNNDGGFSYKPGTGQGFGGGASVMNMTVNAVGSMSIAWMHLSDTPPNLNSEEPKPERQARAKSVARNNSVLEAVPINAPPETGALGETAGIPEGTAKAMKRAYAWITPRFALENPVPEFYGYYYYSLERMAALVNITTIASHDWYGECSDLLLAKQNPDGSWGSSLSDNPLIILALVKSTAKILKRATPIAKFGDGLLQGGRGLPDNLRSGDPAKAGAKPATPLDQLLSSLSKASNLDVEEVQEQVVEQIQISDRRELIQQKELLVKLIQHPHAEIRRTAAWALGRTNDLSLARHLVTALEDPEVDVNVEAHNALCWISRKPGGFDLQLDPFEGLPLDAGPDIREATLQGWRTAALKAWGDWYLKNRPYRERGDEFEAKLREKLALLK